MPQLIPFFYINQISYLIITLLLVLILSSKYVFPHTLKTLLSRMLISTIFKIKK